MDRRRLGYTFYDIFSSLKSEWESAAPVRVPSINLVRKYRVDSAYLRTNRFLFWELNYSRAIFQFHTLHLNRWLRGHVTPVYFSLFYFDFLVFPAENSKFETLPNNFQTIGQIIDTGHRHLTCFNPEDEMYLEKLRTWSFVNHHHLYLWKTEKKIKKKNKNESVNLGK